MIITIDGPAGCGKSTVAKIVADRLGYFYLNSGAMYRAVALAVKESKIRIEDVTVMENFLSGLEIELKIDEQSSAIKYVVNSVDVTDKIGNTEITMLSSDLAKLKVVRSYLVELQRQFGSDKDLVAEGRDMGTCVFPDAMHKFFLTAEVEERAKRRFKELFESGVDEKISYNKVLDDMLHRDKQDTYRKESPLRPPMNAVIIDTTHLALKEVVNQIMKNIQRK